MAVTFQSISFRNFYRELSKNPAEEDLECYICKEAFDSKKPLLGHEGKGVTRHVRHEECHEKSLAMKKFLHQKLECDFDGKEILESPPSKKWTPFPFLMGVGVSAGSLLGTTLIHKLFGYTSTTDWKNMGYLESLPIALGYMGGFAFQFSTAHFALHKLKREVFLSTSFLIGGNISLITAVARRAFEEGILVAALGAIASGIFASE